MTVLAPKYALKVDKYHTQVFSQGSRGRAVVTVQNPIRLGEFSEPEPDVVLAKARDDSYRSVTHARRGDSVAPEALPDLQVPVVDVLGS
jgi:hypothetical protein